jgi:hypothetical protein
MDNNAGPSDVMDVAIIGGGVAGTYTGYRLLKADARSTPQLAAMHARSGRSQLDVRLFEWSDHIGGRLWSINLPGLPGVPAEMGGMRFLQTMENVYGLCKQELGLNVAPFGFANNIQYLRSQRFEWSDYSNPAKVPYALKGKEMGQNPIDLVIHALNTLVPGAVGKSGWDLISYLRSAVVSDPPLFDRPLYETGFWSLLMSQLSIEAYHLVQDASGYFSIYNNWSAYGAFLEFMRNYADSQYLKLADGYQMLPLTLGMKFQQMGGTVQTNRRLHALQPETRGGEPLIRMTIGQPGNPLQWVLYARHVVLALPQRSLQLLDPGSFIFDNAQFRDDILTVRPQAASKLFLSYTEPWWQQLSPPIQTGRSDTDLPLRQCYYFGTQSSGPDAGMSLLMASYNDGMTDEFWDTYLKRSQYGPHQPPYMGRHSGLIDPRLLAPHDMVMEVQRELTEMHNFPVPAPAAAIYHNWVEDPIGAGWYFWNPHVRSWEVAPRIRQPMPGYPVYVCGSCYSENQGWVEGALNTAEMTLESMFGLPRPSWVSPNYYMGP